MTEELHPPQRTCLFRPRLEATAGNRLFPADLAGEWLDELRDVCADLGAGAADPWLSHDLVALVGKLRRCRRELVDRENPDGVLARAESLLEAEPGRVESAWRSLRLDAWRDEVLKLDELDHLDEGDLLDRIDWAVDLLEELDDAELVWAAGQAAFPDDPAWPQRRHELDAAIRHLMNHENAFIPAEAFIQSAAAAIREGLDWRNLADPLAQTIRKYEHLLDLLEFIQEEVTWARLPERSAEPGGGEAVPASRPRLQPGPALPAPRVSAPLAAGETEPAVHLPPLFWRHPRQHLEACLTFPKRLTPEARVPLEFYPTGSASLAGLGEFPVSILLGGLRGEINLTEANEAWASFSYAEIYAVRELLSVLLVRNTRWMARSGPVELLDISGSPPADLS